LDILWKIVGRTLHSDTDLSSWNNLLGIVQSTKDSSSDIFDDSFKLNEVTLIAEICAALVPGIGWKKGTISSNDLIGEETQEFDYFHQYMEDAVIKFFT
jgi:hypothetical protein